MQQHWHADDERRPKGRRFRWFILPALLIYGIYGAWRVFPRFDSRLVGTWEYTALRGDPPTITFSNRGSGHRGNDSTFRWWTCGNKVLMHRDRGSKAANIGAVMEYALRTLVFLEPPSDVTEFTIKRLDLYGAQLVKRPKLSDGGAIASLDLRR